MDDSTANFIVFIGFLIILAGSIIKVIFASPEELDKKIRETDKRRSDAIKKGIRDSKMNRMDQLGKNKDEK